MKKIKFILLGLLSLFVFAGCSDGSGGGADNKEEDRKVIDLNEAAKKKYNDILVGTKWKSPDDADWRSERRIPETVVFSKESIIFDDIVYPLDQNTLTFLVWEYKQGDSGARPNYNCFFKYEDDDDVFLDDDSLLFTVNNTQYRIDIYKLPLVAAAEDTIKDYLSRDFKGSCASIWSTELYEKNEKEPIFNGYSSGTTVVFIGSQNSGSTDGASELTGTYSFTASGGSQTDGSFSLSDGTWTYSGSKTNMAAKSGTYTVDGSTITVKWAMTGGIEVSETFTVSVDGSTATWTSKNSGNSTFFNMLFGVAAQTELEFSYSE